MTERLPWFPLEPERWLGALAGMSARTGLIYSIILLRVYEEGGACGDSTETLSELTGSTTKVVSAAISSLIQEGRLYRSPAGLRNPKADKVIARMSESYAARIKRIKANDSRRPSPEKWIEIRKRIFARDDYTCRYCGVRGGSLECDHMIPICQGGSNEDSNLATACFPCNRDKAGRTVEQWRAL